MVNQSPEQRARDLIDKQLTASGWVIQSKDKINLGAGVGVAVENTKRILVLPITFYF